MTVMDVGYRLEVMGTFRLFAPDGGRVELSSRKGMALIAMLAMASSGERTRAWLQDRLWGSRQREQAQQSLRRELSNLRLKFEIGGVPIVASDRDRVRIDLRRLRVDVLDQLNADRDAAPIAGEFLEGFDIPGEEGFEDWLREMRAALARRLAAPKLPAALALVAAGSALISSSASGASVSAAPDSLPSHVVDLAATTPGFGGRPAIAVLPFDNLTGDAANDYIADGFSVELSERLARLRWMPVIATSTSFAFRGGTLSPTQRAASMGARYLVEGRLLVREADFAVQTYLLDGASGLMVWSQRLTLPQAVSQQAIDEIVRDLVGALDSRVATAEQDRVLHKHIDDLSVDELVWRARWHVQRMTRADADQAARLLDQALALRPNSVDALVQATYNLAWTIWTGRQSIERIRAMRAMALRAIAADAFDSRGHLLVGTAETWLRETTRAKLSLRHAIALNPSHAQAHGQLGSALYLGGDPEGSIAPMRLCLRLSPHDSQAFCTLAEMAMAYTMLDRFDDAVEHAELSITRRPAYWYAHLAKITALLGAGDPAGAKGAHRDLLAISPRFMADHVDWLPFADPAWLRHLKNGLHRSAPGT